MIGKNEKGQAMVEFALVFPFFIILLLLIMDLAWLSYQKVLFSYTSRNIAWQFYDQSLDNWVINNNSHYDISGDYANRLIKEEFMRSSANKGNKIDFNRVQVTGSSISMYAGRRKYPYKVDHYGLATPYRNDVDMNTSTYEIISTIYYDVKPLSPIADLFFEDGIRLKNKVYKVRRGTMRTVN